MSNSYTKAAFAVRMTVSDATVIDAAQRAVDILDTNSDDDELKAAYAGLDPDSRTSRTPRAPHRRPLIQRCFVRSELLRIPEANHRR